MNAKLLCFSLVLCVLINQGSSIFFNNNRQEEQEQTYHVHYIHHYPSPIYGPPAQAPESSWGSQGKDDSGGGGILNFLKKLFTEGSSGSSGNGNGWDQGGPRPVYGPPSYVPPPAISNPRPVYGPPPQQKPPIFNPPNFNPKPVYGPPPPQNSFLPSQKYPNTDSYFPQDGPNGGYHRRVFQVEPQDNEKFMNTINTAIQESLQESDFPNKGY